MLPAAASLRIQVANSRDVAAEQSKPRQRGHGYGTGIVQQTVARYAGSYQVTQTSENYQVNIQLISTTP